MGVCCGLKAEWDKGHMWHDLEHVHKCKGGRHPHTLVLICPAFPLGSAHGCKARPVSHPIASRSTVLIHRLSSKSLTSQIHSHTHIHTPWFIYLCVHIGWVEAWTFVFGFSERPNPKPQELYWDVMCMKGRGSPTRGHVCIGLHSKSLHSALYSFKTAACICLQTT